jgi:hypothetical protein
MFIKADAIGGFASSQPKELSLVLELALCSVDGASREDRLLP